MSEYKRNKIRTALNIIRKIRNWPEGLRTRLFKKGEGLSLLNFRDGFSIIVREGTQDWDIVHELFFANSYLRAMQWLAALPSPAPRVLDLGGNIGAFTLLTHRYKPGARITAFEPGPPNIRIFQMNMLANNLPAEQIELRPQAVAGTSGKAIWYFDSANPGASSLYGSKGISAEVQLVSLAEVIAEAKEDIALLKIDIEGAEFDILAQTPVAVWQHVQAISLELHDDPSGRKNHGDFINEMKSLGFQVESESVCSYFLHR